MSTKRKTAKVAATDRRRVAPPMLPIEDDERHLEKVDDYISRNRDALNASIKRSRKEIAEGSGDLALPVSMDSARLTTRNAHQPQCLTGHPVQSPCADRQILSRAALKSL